MKHTIIPTDSELRKKCPIHSGVLAYFPDAMYAVAMCSYLGNEKHNPDTHLHWDRAKSGDELDACTRHSIDGEWENLAWRALANLQKKIEDGYVPAGFPNHEAIMQELSDAGQYQDGS